MGELLKQCMKQLKCTKALELLKIFLYEQTKVNWSATFDTDILESWENLLIVLILMQTNLREIERERGEDHTVRWQSNFKKTQVSGVVLQCYWVYTWKKHALTFKTKTSSKVSCKTTTSKFKTENIKCSGTFPILAYQKWTRHKTLPTGAVV